MKNPLRRTLSFFLALTLAVSPLTAAAEGRTEEAENAEILESIPEKAVTEDSFDAGVSNAEAMAATVASGTCGTKMKWTLDANGLLTISGSGKMDNYSESANAPWTRYYRSNINSIVISDGVTSIGNYAFYSCYNVDRAVIPFGVTSIGNHAYGECVWLSSVDIPNSVISIGDNAFSGCFSLTDVAIPESVTSIGQGAFANTGLKSITVPDSVTSLGSFAFACAENSNLRNAAIGKGVTRIAPYLFSSCYLLSYVEITDSIAEVCENAFQDCYALTDVFFTGTEEQWNKITVRAGNDSFTNAKIHYNCTSGSIVTGSGTCGENVNWLLSEDGVLTVSGSGKMEDYAYFASVPWNLLVKYIHSVHIEDGITSIGNYAFSDCDNLTDVVIGKRVSRIGEYAFCDCDSLTNIEFPSSLTSLGEYAFHSCGSLSCIDLPHDVSFIGVGAFANCSKLTDISVSPVNYVYSAVDGVLFNKGKTVLIQCPAGKSGTYAVPNGVTELGIEAFSGCEGLTSILLPNTVTKIGDAAFLGCTSINSMVFPEKILQLGTEIFVESRHLSEIYFSGDAPAFAPFTFDTVRATAYYPKENKTWTASVRRNYGGTISWKEYLPSEMIDDVATVDNLAFSQLVGENLQIGKTVYETLQSKWNTSVFADNPQITYGALYGRLANWKVVSVSDAWPDARNDGFYAAAFQGMTQKGRRTVIAFRGSANPAAEGIISEAVLNDWIENDIEFQAFHTYTPQLQDAPDYYAYCMTISAINQSRVTVTGHSLGGALSSMVSLVFGVQGETFNSASAFEALYLHAPLLAGRQFTGVDCWNSVCHVINGDKISNWPWVSEVKEFSYFPNKIYQYAGNDSGLVNKHLLGGFLRLVDGKAELTTPISVNLHPNKAYYTEQSMVVPELYLGTSSPNRKTLTNNQPFTENEGHFMYGGDGNDELVSVTKSNDIIIGGPGSDLLDGGKGDDTFYFFKGNGCQTIHDAAGNDKIILVNFSPSDSLSYLSDSNFVTVYCNGNPILRISRNRKKGNPIRIYDACSLRFTLTDFNWTGSMKSSQVECPTDIDILDSGGKVVQTLRNGEDRTVYTDYGNFYVFPNEEGESVKYVDLIEGYSFRIRGVDDGTMNVMYCQDDSEVYYLSDVPVQTGMTAAISEPSTENETPILIIDTDSDGKPDSLLPMADSISNQPISIDQAYLVLNADDSAQLSVHTEPMELNGAVVWNVNALSSDEPVISVDSNGVVTALRPGTAEAVASVTVGEETYSARCRIDVVEKAGSTQPIADEVSVNGITLLDTKAAVDLYRTDYTRISVLLNLTQNLTAFAEGAGENTGHAIQSARFADEAVARNFALRVADDRTLEIIPTEYALANPGAVKNAKSAIVLTVDGVEFTTAALTLTVKKTLPTVKAKAIKINSFDAAPADLTFTGAKVLAVEPEGALPAGFALEGMNVVYTGSAAKTSAKLNLLATVENLAVKRPVTVSVSVTRTEPTVKLSASSVTLLPGSTDKVTLTVNRPEALEIAFYNGS